MSQNLADIDLSAITGQFTLDTRGTQFQSCGWLEFINASPYTLYIQMGGYNFKCPAWYHMPVQLQVKNGPYWKAINGANFPCKITPSLLGASTTNLSTMLLPVLYMTGETPATTTPQPLAHQTYIPNNVSTVGTETLSNEGNPVNTLVVDIGDVNISQLIKLFTDHFAIAVDQAGVKHLALQGQTSGNPLLIGQTGDTSEVSGSLLIDQNLTIDGNAIFANSKPIQWKMANGTVWSILFLDSSNNVGLQAATGSGNQVRIKDETGTTQLSVDDISPQVQINNDVSIGGVINSALYVDTASGVSSIRMGTSILDAGNLLDNPVGGSLYIKNPSPTAQSFTFQSPNGTTRANFLAFNFGFHSGTSGTVTHGLGGTPTAVIITPIVSQPGSATCGVGNLTSTTFAADVGAGTGFYWFAIR